MASFRVWQSRKPDRPTRFQNKLAHRRLSLPGTPSISFSAKGGLLLPPESVLCRLGDSEFDDRLGWNLDLLLRLRIEAEASFPFLLYELAKSRQDEFAFLFDRFVGEVAERSRNTPAILLLVSVAAASATWSSVLVMSSRCL